MASRSLFLVLALARYSGLDRVKNCQRIACHPQATISVPMFSEALDVSWHKLVGGIKHVGLSPQSGHYRSFAVHCNASPQVNAVHDSPSARLGASDCNLWQFDDGVKPQSWPSQCSHHAYFLSTLTEQML